MKTSFRLPVALSLCLSAGLLRGQSTLNNGTAPALSSPTHYSIVQKDANSQLWERTVYELDPSGRAVPKKHRYMELSTGLNFWDSTTSQWKGSKEEIDILPNGTAAATQGQHQAYFPGDIAGMIELVTPDGLKLQKGGQHTRLEQLLRRNAVAPDVGIKFVKQRRELLQNRVHAALDGAQRMVGGHGGVEVDDRQKVRLSLRFSTHEFQTPPHSFCSNVFQQPANADVIRSLNGIGSDPSGLDVDSSGNVYVAVTANNQVWKFNQVGTLTPVSVQNDNAEYYFQQTIAGQTVIFMVEFVKENGVWKIEEF